LNINDVKSNVVKEIPYYNNLKDLPEWGRDNLPDMHEIFKKAFNNAWGKSTKSEKSSREDKDEQSKSFPYTMKYLNLSENSPRNKIEIFAQTSSIFLSK
jgi:cation transport regulator ChaB